MVHKINHIGIMVNDIEKGAEQFKRLGLSVSKRVVAEEFNCEIAFLPCGDVMLELVRPLGPGNGMKFLEQHGEGIHHICFEVDDLQKAYQEYQECMLVREDGIKIGAEGKDVFFVKPESLCGTLTEYTEAVTKCD